MRPGDSHAQADVASGIYERHYSLQPGDTVLDLGAHVGYFTALAASKVGSNGLVIAFEPHPDNFALLRERVGALANVALIHAAAHMFRGIYPLYHNEGNSGGHSLAGGPNGPYSMVPCVLVSDYLAGREVRFVKCDVEGAEYGVLFDLLMALEHPIDIALEVHSADLYASCSALLRERGYEFEPPEPHVGVCYAWKR